MGQGAPVSLCQHRRFQIHCEAKGLHELFLVDVNTHHFQLTMCHDALLSQDQRETDLILLKWKSLRAIQNLLTSTDLNRVYRCPLVQFHEDVNQVTHRVIVRHSISHYFDVFE